MAQEFKIGRLRYTWRGYWETGVFYNRDAVVAFDGKTYVCIVPHTASDFYEDYTNVEESGEINPYWVLMLEGQTWKGDWAINTDYTLGAIVLYGGTVYKCIANHNSGTVFDFTKWSTYIEVNSRWVSNYTASTFYYKGDTVKYGGIVYRCITQHTSSSSVVIDLTKWEELHIGIEFKGPWDDNNVHYKVNDIVKYGPDLWICQDDHFSTATFDGTTDLNDETTTWKIWIPGLEYGSSWNALTEYQPGDTVVYGGYAYISLTVNNVGNVPSLEAGDWSLVTTGYSFQQEWAANSQYKIGALVRRGGNTFVALRDNTGQDPTADVVTTTYTAAGSSGRTLVVANTAGIVPGMYVTGLGFNKQQIVTSVTNSTTLRISEAPYSSTTNGAALQFSGVNDQDWSLVVPSVRWRNRWTAGTTYVVGDIAVWVNKTYKCIRTHSSVDPLRPDQDVNNSYWVIFLLHDRNNVLNKPGDIIVSSNGVNTALPIGEEGYLLKSVQGVPTWSSFLQTPAVYYVTPDGTDQPTSGRTWDNPYKTIKYACNQVAQGTLNTAVKNLLVSNKTFIVEETYQWMLYQIANNISPFTGNPILSQEKTRRDIRYLIDAVIYDLGRGGNSQTVAYTLSYFDKVGQYQYATIEVAAQIQYYIATINRCFSVILGVATSTPVTSYQLLNNVPAPISQLFGAPADPQVSVDILSYQTVITTALGEGDTSTIPAENQGLTATIQVKTGTYYEELPIVIPANTALNGDELRGVVVYPKVIINTVVTRSQAILNRFTCKTTAGMTDGTPVQFDSINSVNGVNSVFGGVTRGTTYYVIGTSITPTTFSIRNDIGSTIQLETFNSVMYVYGGDALKDMFRCQNGTGIRNMTMAGLLGCLTEENDFLTRRPTGGAYTSLDPGFGPDDTSAWIYRKSPYVQNVTTFGKGATGLKIDGTLHNGGNKSIVCNDFTQIISDGIGVWTTGPGALCEAVSVFSYYAYAGYFSEAGGRLRATNGNSSYGTFGVVAEGFDESEVPISGFVDNQYFQAQATPFSSLGSQAEILKIQYSTAGEQYLEEVTNLLRYSNGFTNGSWTNDSNVTLVQTVVSPFGFSDAWIATGNTSGTDSSVISQAITIAPSGAQYVGLSGVNITGSGAGATFNVIVTSTEYIVSVNAGGSGYVVSNQIRILGSQLGGINDDNDLIITITGLSGTSVATITTTGTVQVGSTQPYTYSLYVKKGTSPSIDLVATFSGNSTSSSFISFNFLTETIIPGNLNGGIIPTQYSAIPITTSDGWYRLSFVFYDGIALNNTLTVKIYPRSRLGNSGFSYIYGSQLEKGNSLGFYLETRDDRFSSYANFKIVGPGQNARAIGDEIRASSIFQTRVLEIDRVTGGDNHLIATNNAQAGDTTSITIAASDTVGDKPYLGMRVFINSGTGAGQYGTIASYDSTSKIATVLNDVFDQVEITEIAGSDLSLSINADVKTLYLNQPIRFIPTSYDIEVQRVSQSSMDVLGTIGGTVNQLTVETTAPLAVDMPVNFSGTTYGGVTDNFTYYIIAIIDEIRIQVSTTIGGPVVFLNTNSGDMQLNYPNNTSYIQGDTFAMEINLPIYFTGSVLSTIEAATTYYINDIFNGNEFTISSALIEVTATNTTEVTNAVNVGNSEGLVPLNPITFTGTAFGGLNPGIKYYINHIINSTSISVSSNTVTTTATSTLESSDLVTVASTAGFVLGNPVVFSGTVFGGIENEQVYYVHYVNDATTFSISNVSNPLSISVTGTSATNNRLTAVSNSNLLPMVPIKFSGTTFGNIIAGTEYYVNRTFGSTEFTVSPSVLSRTATQSSAVSNLITVDSTLGFVADNPIIFGGLTFGGIQSGVVYYISAVNDATSFTISSTPGGAAFTLAPGSGTVTCRTPAASVTLATASGTMTGTSRFVGSAQSLTTGVGQVIVRTTNSAVTLTTDSGTLDGTTTTAKEILEADAGSMRGTFSVPLLGDVDSNTTYYVKTITPGATNTFTVSTTPGGTVSTFTNDTGSMQMGQVGWSHINSGYPLAVAFDSTTVYSIEPRISYPKPPFSINASTTILQATGTEYVSICYGNGKFVGVPNNNATLAVSTNGLIWTSQTLPSIGVWRDIAYGNGYWVLISNTIDAGDTTQKVLYSNSDLATWKKTTMPSSATWTKVVYGNGVFIAMASNGTLARSTNFGASWSTVGPAGPFSASDITYGANIFSLIVSGSTTVYYSTDAGVTWTSSTMPRSTNWSAIAYGNGRFVAIATTVGKAAYSHDSITWSESNYDVGGSHLSYGNGLFVATGDESSGPFSYITEDGLTWDTKTSVLNVKATAFGITSNIGKFVSVSGRENAFVIAAGSKAKARPVVTNEKITQINEWDPGSNYLTTPTVTISDTNATIVATLDPLTGSGVLGNPTFVNRGSGYNTNTTTITIDGGGYADAFQTGISLICKNLSRLPSPGDNLAIDGDTTIYKVTAAVTLDGTSPPNVRARIDVSPEITVGLSPDHDTPVSIRTKYSQARLTNHDYLNIGFGNFEESNYPRLPLNTVLSPQNETVESNYGRVFYSSTDQDGNFRVGELFAVEQATGIVTLSASQFGLEGLNELKIGGVAIGGSSVIITQFSTDSTFVANSNNIIPTQKAIKSYLTARLTQGGSNTFTGQLIAGTVLVGGPDRIQSTVPEGNPGSRVTMPSVTKFSGVDGGMWDGDGVALQYFFKTMIADRGVENGT